MHGKMRNQKLHLHAGLQKKLFEHGHFSFCETVSDGYKGWGSKTVHLGCIRNSREFLSTIFENYIKNRV